MVADVVFVGLVVAGARVQTLLFMEDESLETGFARFYITFTAIAVVLALLALLDGRLLKWKRSVRALVQAGAFVEERVIFARNALALGKACLAVADALLARAGSFLQEVALRTSSVAFALSRVNVRRARCLKA